MSEPHLYPPCKNCEKRSVGCHSSCADYISYKEHRENRRAELKGIREGNAFCYSVKGKINHDWRHERYHGRSK